MKKLLTKIVGATLGLALAIGVSVGATNNREAKGVYAGTNTTTYTFSTKSWAASPANWTSGKAGNAMTSGRGVQVTTGATGANATSPTSFTDVSQIVVTYSTNASAGAGSVLIQVGTNGAVSKNVTSTGGTTDRTLTWDYDPSQTGAVKITVNCSTNSIYVKSVAITHYRAPETLSSPQNVAYNSSLQRVTWSAVEHATGYYFSSDNGANYSNKTTNLYYDVSGLADGSYNVKIKAAGDGGTDYNDSAAASFSLIKVSTPIIESVTINKASISGSYKGSAFIQCSAVVNGQNNPSQDVTWSITSTNSFGTSTEVDGKATIDQTGKVIFLDNIDTLYVWALAADGETKGSTTVSADGLTYVPGTVNNPYTVAQATSAISSSANDLENVYITGKISQIDQVSTQYHNATYWISDDGTTEGQFKIYQGKYLNNQNFTSEDQISLGDLVIVYGTISKQYSNLNSGNYITSLTPTPRVSSVSLTPSAVQKAPNATGDVDLLFTNIVINQNETSHKTVSDIDWSSDDENVIYIDGGEYLVTGSHRDSTTIKASIGGVEYGSATFTVIDPNVYVMNYDTTIWTKVTNPSTLVPGDKVILTGVKSDVTYAAGKFVSGGSNVQADTANPLVVSGNKVTGVVDTMIYTLEAGTVANSVAFRDSSGKYLYASSSSANQLKAQDEIDDNASFVLGSDSTVIAQGENSRKSMRYNNVNTSNLFNCYVSGSSTGDAVVFYKCSGNSGEIDLPSLSVIQTAFDDGNESYIRLGVQLSEDDWDSIDSAVGISGYGVMLVRETTLTTSGFVSVEEAFRSTANNKPTLKDLSRESNTAPQDHFIAARINITLNSNIDVVFCAATYVISSNGSYCFINEVSGSLYDLI